jgi:hypothetical protein
MYQVWSKQWILTKLGTYLVLKRIWNPIDFQGHRSKSPGQIFRQGDMPRFALPLFTLVHVSYNNGSKYVQTNVPGSKGSEPWRSKGQVLKIKIKKIFLRISNGNVSINGMNLHFSQIQLHFPFRFPRILVFFFCSL